MSYALKVVRSDDEEILKITEKEFELMFSLEPHKNIIQVYDIF